VGDRERAPTPTASTVATTARRPLGRWIMLLAVVLGCCLLGELAVLAIDPIATSIARRRLHARGVECDDRLAVDLAAAFGAATLAPTTCTVATGPIESFAIVDPVELTLAGASVRAIRAGRVQIVVRVPPPVVAAGGWGAALEMLGIPERLGLLAHGLAELAAQDRAAVDAQSIEIVHAGRATATLTGVRLGAGSPMSIEVARITLPALSLPFGLDVAPELAAVRGSATAARVELDGDLAGSGAVLTLLRALLPSDLPLDAAAITGRRIGIVVEGLDTPSPTYRPR
jgi:hypothetical protein